MVGNVLEWMISVHICLEQVQPPVSHSLLLSLSPPMTGLATDPFSFSLYGWLMYKKIHVRALKTDVIFGVNVVWSPITSAEGSCLSFMLRYEGECEMAIHLVLSCPGGFEL